MLTDDQLEALRENSRLRLEAMKASILGMGRVLVAFSVGVDSTFVLKVALRVFRLRYHGEVARLEIAADEYEKFHDPGFRHRVSADLKRRGFSFVSVDLEPFRSGRMNEAAFPLTVPSS